MCQLHYVKIPTFIFTMQGSNDVML